MKRRIKRWSIRISLIVLTAYAGICFFMYFSQESILFHPTVMEQNEPVVLSDGGSGFEEIWLTASDGAKIHSLYFPSGMSHGIVLYLHGNGGNVAICSKSRHPFLHNGYDFFIVDYRGYGKSTGEVSEAGLHADAEAAWTYLKERFPEKKIVIYGQSMGSGIAVQLAARHTPARLILEAPYTSIVDVASNDYPWLPVSLLLNFPLKSSDYIDKIDCPITIFHGDKDDVIPYDQGKMLAEKAKNAELITLPGCDHNGCQKAPGYAVNLSAALQ